MSIKDDHLIKFDLPIIKLIRLYYPEFSLEPINRPISTKINLLSFSVLDKFTSEYKFTWYLYPADVIKSRSVKHYILDSFVRNLNFYSNQNHSDIADKLYIRNKIIEIIENYNLDFSMASKLTKRSEFSILSIIKGEINLIYLQELQLIYEALISSNAVLWPLVKNLLEVHSQCIPIMSRLVATNDQQIIEAFYNQLQELPYDKLYTIYINLLISIELSSYSC